MARLNHNPYAPQNLNELRNPRLIVVDMINGFVREGALADPEIARTAVPILRLLEQTEGALFIRDCHEPDCMEFESFPSHCVRGSEESEIMQELKPWAGHVLEKNSINTFTAPGFLEWLESVDSDTDLIITGCCTDLCILQLALSLQSWIHEHDRRDLRIFIPADCVDTYHIPGVHEAAAWNAFALHNMEANGIHVVSKLQQNGN